jgi:hypothetical protein
MVSTIKTHFTDKRATAKRNIASARLGLRVPVLCDWEAYVLFAMGHCLAGKDEVGRA